MQLAASNIWIGRLSWMSIGSLSSLHSCRFWLVWGCGAIWRRWQSRAQGQRDWTWIGTVSDSVTGESNLSIIMIPTGWCFSPGSRCLNWCLETCTSWFFTIFLSFSAIQLCSRVPRNQQCRKNDASSLDASGATIWSACHPLWLVNLLHTEHVPSPGKIS